MNKSEKVSFIIEVLAIIIALLFLANYIRLTANSGILTFESLVEQCSNFTSIRLTSLIDMTIRADWSIFNFLRDFINMFTSLLSVSIYLASLVLNSLWFVVQFIGIFML